MIETGISPAQMQVLRSIIFAGALESTSDIIGYRGSDLASDIAHLEAGALIETDGVIVPTEAGLALLETSYAHDRADLDDEQRDAVVARFRPLDREIKRLAIAWQDAEDRDDWDARMSVIEALSALQARTSDFIADHRAALPRFAEFGDRLGEALTQILDGNTDYVVSVRLPSYHTVWFEFHEDLLRTLQRQRDPE